jgi:putative flavoprotein involved in K+ transport
MESEHVETVIVGGGQAGLATGYYLKRFGRPFVILDAEGRIGDAWRRRWDSLRLFTYARYDGLPGLRFPAPGWSLPSKDDMADYLERYAAIFELDVRAGVTVDRLERIAGRFVLTAADRRFEADNVVIATGAHRIANVPGFAGELDPTILQLHSSEYRRPFQLRDGGVLIVGAGNSGAEIAMELVHKHPTWLSGRDTGHVPVRIEGLGKVGFPVFRFLMHHLAKVSNPLGRRIRQKEHGKGDPLVRVKPKDILRAGVERVGRVSSVRGGLPELEDGRVLEVTNVIWCTGFRSDFSWIDLPVFGSDGEPIHDRGVAQAEPGLTFVGLPFQYSASSSVLPGIGRDHAYIARHIASRDVNGSLAEDSPGAAAGSLSRA